MRILFVEDEAPARSGLTALLCSQGDIVVSAESCEAAEKAFRACAYDLVILDIILPSGLDERPERVIMDAGVALLHNLRKGNIRGSKTRRDVPVVALTAVANEAILDRIREQRGVYLAQKPIDPEEVVQLIHAATAK